MSNLIRYLIILMFVGGLFFGAWVYFKGHPVSSPQPEESLPFPEISSTPSSKQYDSPPEVTIDPDKKYSANIKTNQGNIEIELFAKETPKTVNNFIFLARDDFYDGLKFHRIVEGFMIQGGDPKGDGTGGPGYKFDDELITRDYRRGIVAMANSGPNTNGSQFFIMHQDYDLPKNYVIFGQVISGIETVDAIAETSVGESPSGEKSIPLEDVIIEDIEILEH